MPFLVSNFFFFFFFFFWGGAAGVGEVGVQGGGLRRQTNNLRKVSLNAGSKCVGDSYRS